MINSWVIASDFTNGTKIPYFGASCSTRGVLWFWDSSDLDLTRFRKGTSVEIVQEV